MTGKLTEASKHVAQPWYRPNRYDAARAFATWFWVVQHRKPDTEDAFVAGVLWEADRAALSAIQQDTA